MASFVVSEPVPRGGRVQTRLTRGSQKKEATKVQKEASVNTGYFICDKRGRFLSANERILALTGYSEEELLELAITDMMSEEDAQDFTAQVFQNSDSETGLAFTTQLRDKMGELNPVELKLRPITDENTGRIIGFRGYASVLPVRATTSLASTGDGPIDQEQLISEVVNTVYLGYTEPLNVVLRRVAESVGQIFGFKRSTVALLDRRKRVFVKQAMVGYSSTTEGSIERRSIEVPQEVIDRIFADRFKIKVIYHTQDQRDTQEYISPGVPERRTQRRREDDEWHKRDLILMNLMDHKGRTFGYISLDDPLEGQHPNRQTFHNLELFSSLISMAIENYYRFSNVEKRNRRLKQALVNSNIFKLYLSLNELLKEVVWSVKFTLDFNLVSLVLISKKSGQLETKAVACEDKIKLLQIRELGYDLKAFSELLRDEYRQGKSYLVNEEHTVLRHLKRIYYGSNLQRPTRNGWPCWGVVLVPIKSREGKIIGFLVADDPADQQIPSKDAISVLEIMANQIAIAIDNRVMYVQSKENKATLAETTTRVETEPPKQEELYEDKEEDYAGGGLRKLVEKFLR